MACGPDALDADSPERAAVRPVRIRDRTGVVSVERRHADLDVSVACAAPGSSGLARRRQPRLARRLGRDAVLLTGYGGFNISLTPAFDPSDFLWLDAGGTIAVANLRGGGEYGDAWHRAGMRERKQNVFDDFIAAAEWLRVDRARRARAASRSKAAATAACWSAPCLVQRPDLFGAAICRVPVADMLRYHRFTVGRFWIPEYGCADDAADFRVSAALLAVSQRRSTASRIRRRS